MTNSEMIEKLEKDGLSSISDMEFITKALEENTKLKAEIEQFADELISVRIENELLKKKNELTNYYFEQYSAAIDEIEQYQKETSADKIDYAYDLGYQSCLNHNGVGWVDAEEIQKLRKEIEQLKADYSVLTRQYNNVENSSIRYYNEVKQLKSELEQSVRLPCKVGDNLYRPVPRLYKDIAKMKVKGFKIDEYGFRFETTKGTEWNCSSIGKTIFLTREEAEQSLKGKVE